MSTIFQVRKWERFQFMIDFEAQKVWHIKMYNKIMLLIGVFLQHKEVLERTLPDELKLSIAEKIENNLFSKVAMKLKGSSCYLGVSS
jgi:hypothetical protein